MPPYFSFKLYLIYVAFKSFQIIRRYICSGYIKCLGVDEYARIVIRRISHIFNHYLGLIIVLSQNRSIDEFRYISTVKRGYYIINLLCSTFNNNCINDAWIYRFGDCYGETALVTRWTMSRVHIIKRNDWLYYLIYFYITPLNSI